MKSFFDMFMSKSKIIKYNQKDRVILTRRYTKSCHLKQLYFQVRNEARCETRLKKEIQIHVYCYFSVFDVYSANKNIFNSVLSSVYTIKLDGRFPNFGI